jgi:hypothetical protein
LHRQFIKPEFRFLPYLPSIQVCLSADNEDCRHASYSGYDWHPPCMRAINMMMVNIKWLWVAMLGGSILLALPGHSDIGAIMGDVVGHFFSAFILAILPILGYWLFYKQISEKIITYIFSTAWIYLVLSQFFGM